MSYVKRPSPALVELLRRQDGVASMEQLASHCFDLLDFLIGPIADVTGYAVNTGGSGR